VIEEASATLTLAEDPGLALLRARTVTVPPAARICGAVNVVLFGEICEFKIEPTVVFPPTTPFTSHVTVVSAAPVTTAWKFCVVPRSTDAAGGVIVTLITGATVIGKEVTFVGSASGAAMILKFGGSCGIAGAV
jgi:hypothetical protein